MDKANIPSALLVSLDGLETVDLSETKKEPVKRLFTLDMALTSLGFGVFHFFLLLLCGVGFAAGTIQLLLVPLLISPLKEFFKLDIIQLSLLPILGFLGEAAGNFFWGWFSDRFGRRYAFWITSAILAALSLSISFSSSYSLLLTLRFFIGFALGGSLGQDFLIFMEFMPVKHRAKASCVIILLGIVGYLYVALAGYVVLPKKGWRIFLIVCSCPCMLCFLLRCTWFFETPRYLIAENKPEEALRVLKVAARFNKKNLPKGELAPLPNIRSNPSFFFNIGPFTELWADHRRQAALISAIWFLQSFSIYGISLWLSEYVAFKGLPETDTRLSYLYMAACQPFGLALVTVVLDRIGKKHVVSVAMAGSSVCAAAILLANVRVTVYICFCLVNFFSVGTWTAIYIFTPELFPTSLRGNMSGITGMFSKFGGAISALIGGFVTSKKISVPLKLGIYATGFLIGAMMAVFLKEPREEDGRFCAE